MKRILVLLSVMFVFASPAFAATDITQWFNTSMEILEDASFSRQQLVQMGQTLPIPTTINNIAAVQDGIVLGTFVEQEAATIAGQMMNLADEADLLRLTPDLTPHQVQQIDDVKFIANEIHGSTVTVKLTAADWLLIAFEVVGSLEEVSDIWAEYHDKALVAIDALNDTKENIQNEISDQAQISGACAVHDWFMYHGGNQDVQHLLFVGETAYNWSVQGHAELDDTYMGFDDTLFDIIIGLIAENGDTGEALAALEDVSNEASRFGNEIMDAVQSGFLPCFGGGL
jgi:hypothetical protein